MVLYSSSSHRTFMCSVSNRTVFIAARWEGGGGGGGGGAMSASLFLVERKPVFSARQGVHCGCAAVLCIWERLRMCMYGLMRSFGLGKATLAMFCVKQMICTK